MANNSLSSTNPLGHPYPHAKLRNVKLTPISQLSRNASWLSRHKSGTMIYATTQSHAQMMLRKRLAGELRGANSMIPTTAAIKVRARQLADAKVRDHIKRQGLKRSSLSCAELKGWTDLFLEDNPQLIEQARHEVEAWARAGFFGKRVQRQLLANILSNAQPTQPCSNKEISVQMLGAK